jgi:hypothetical protein
MAGFDPRSRQIASGGQLSKFLILGQKITFAAVSLTMQ